MVTGGLCYYIMCSSSGGFFSQVVTYTDGRHHSITPGYEGKIPTLQRSCGNYEIAFADGRRLSTPNICRQDERSVSPRSMWQALLLTN